MKKRTPALPSRVHVYGCSAPLENAEAVFQQMFLANRYRNQLVEIERARRTVCQAIVGHADSELAALDAQIEPLTTAIDAAKAEKKTRNSIARKRSRHPDLTAQIAILTAQRTPLREQRKLVKADAYQNPVNKAALLASTEAANAAVRAARKIASRVWGLYWGTYLVVEDAAKTMGCGKPPTFRRFDRTHGGTLAVQIQVAAGKARLSPERLLEGRDARVQLIPEDMRADAGRRRRARPQYLLRLCIGGTDPQHSISRTKNPATYTTVRMTLHRPLPAGSHVTWVKLHAQRVGTKLVWTVHMTIAQSGGFSQITGPGTAGLDIGYRSLPGTEITLGGQEYRSLRVAAWAGTDGQHGELTLPPDLVAALAHKADLQALRDQKFDIIRPTLNEWRKHLATPEWFATETATLGAWKSQARLKRLVLRWGKERFVGDEGMYEQMDAWRREDNHHLDWLANEATRARYRRDDLYRKFAVEMRRHYGVMGLEDLDLREHAQAEELSKAVQRQRGHAAVSRLRLFLAQAGLEIVKVPAPNTTKRCHRCLTLNEVGTEMTYYCTHCGWTGDRDYNAAQNILRETLAAPADLQLVAA